MLKVRTLITWLISVLLMLFSAIKESGSSPHKISLVVPSICCDSPVEAIFWRNCVSFLYYIPNLLGTETDNRHWVSRRFTLLFSSFTVLKLWKSFNPFSHWSWRSFSPSISGSTRQCFFQLFSTLKKYTAKFLLKSYNFKQWLIVCPT